MENSRFYAVLLIVCLFPGARLWAQEHTSIEMTIGEQRVFRVPGVATVSIGGEGKIADAKKIGKDQFVLFATGKGRTSLIVVFRNGRSQNWNIKVRGDEVEKFRYTCEKFLGSDGCVGLSVTEAGDKLVLSGRIQDLETYHKLKSLKKAFPDLVLMVEVPPRVLDALVFVINEELEKAGLGNARVTRVAKRLILEGTVADEQEKKKAQAIVEALYENASLEGISEGDN